MDSFESWADDASGGDGRLRGILVGCLTRFLGRFGCTFVESPAPGYAGLLRMFRSAAAVTSEGTVRSADLFAFADLPNFLSDPDERAAVLRGMAWDDRATLFAERQPPRRTRETPSPVDHSGGACLSSVPDQVRQFEYLLWNDLGGDPAACRVFDVVPVPDDAADRFRKGLPPRGPARGPLRDALRSSFGIALAADVASSAPAALAAFRAALDPGRLEALAAAGANGVVPYNWLSGKDRGRTDPRLGTMRTQAVRAYPVAWKLISDPASPVSAAVAEGSPLVPELSAALGVDARALRRMNGLSAADAGIAGTPDAADAERIARRVARMPPGAPPATPGGWACFFGSLDLADAVDATAGQRPPGTDLLARCAGKWDGMDALAVGQAAAGFRDMLADFHANLCEPLARLAGNPVWPPAASSAALAGGRTLAQLAETSKWWHAHQGGIRLHLGTAYPLDPGRTLPRVWPPLHAGGAWAATNGLLLCPLVDASMLEAEHVAMSHCVNTYDTECMFGGCHILSVRAGGGPPLGTAEISQGAILALAGTMTEPPNASVLDLPAGVVQFKGHSNHPPPIRAWEALWDYVTAIATGALKLDGDFLESEMARRRTIEPTASRRAGGGAGRWAVHYDAGTEAAVLDAWGRYSPMLPKAAVRRGPMAFVGGNPG